MIQYLPFCSYPTGSVDLLFDEIVILNESGSTLKSCKLETDSVISNEAVSTTSNKYMFSCVYCVCVCEWLLILYWRTDVRLAQKCEGEIQNTRHGSCKSRLNESNCLLISFNAKNIYTSLFPIFRSVLAIY